MARVGNVEAVTALLEDERTPVEDRNEAGQTPLVRAWVGGWVGG